MIVVPTKRVIGFISPSPWVRAFMNLNHREAPDCSKL